MPRFIDCFCIKMYLRITVGILVLTSYVYLVTWAKRKHLMLCWVVGAITFLIVVMVYYGQEYLYLHMDPIRSYTTGRPRPNEMVDVAVGRWGAVAGYVPVLRPHAAAARLLGFVMRSVYPNETHVRGTDMPPLLMLSAGGDGVIPPAMHIRVFEAYNNTVKKLVRTIGQHAHNMEFAKARLAMKRFICDQF